MPLRDGIAQWIEAIEDRVEVAGHAPTWRVTAGSFESAWRYAREAYPDPVVIDRQDRERLWRRVTLTVTTDPDLAAGAPDLETFSTPRVPQPRGGHDTDRLPAADSGAPEARSPAVDQPFLRAFLDPGSEVQEQVEEPGDGEVDRSDGPPTPRESRPEMRPEMRPEPATSFALADLFTDRTSPVPTPRGHWLPPVLLVVLTALAVAVVVLLFVRG